MQGPRRKDFQPATAQASSPCKKTLREELIKRGRFPSEAVRLKKVNLSREIRSWRISPESTTVKPPFRHEHRQVPHQWNRLLPRMKPAVVSTRRRKNTP